MQSNFVNYLELTKEKEVLMENVIRILGLGILLFLLYSLFFADDSSSLTMFILIASASSFVLYFISVKYFNTKNE